MPDAKDNNVTFDWGPGSPDESLSGLDPVIAKAKRRFERAMKWESTARTRWLNDLKFAEADSDNWWQWPSEIRRNRDVEARPCLTINKTRQHNLQIINDAKQNKPGITARPTGNGATYESAQCIQNLFRHTEYISHAQSAYMVAVGFQVKSGMGYWRVTTDYVSDRTFDQEIYIRPIPDPLTVLLDPDIREFNGSDARWGFIFEDIPRDEFLTLYPEYRDNPPPGGALGQETDWINKDKVRRAEYFDKRQVEDRLWEFEDPQVPGQLVTLLGSVLDELPKETVRELKAQPTTRSRKVLRTEIHWFMIVGEEVKSHRIWPGKYVPIVRLVGEETVVEGLLDRKGHTRALKDCQRIYNYWSSSAVEFGALQSKSPYVSPADAIEGFETYWGSANTENHSVLPYNHQDDDGNPIPAPQRQQPPEMASAHLEGMKISSEEMMMVSGQYQAQMGQQGNERSRAAIDARQRQGDNSTYHFIDNLGMAIAFTGEIVLDLIPHIYDTKRVFQIQAIDGKDMAIEIDPGEQQAYKQRLDHEGEVIAHVLNPKIGEYWVEADVGPAYGTRRQEAFNAFSLIMAENPAVAQIIGDLYFKSADFPLADEAASRMRRAVPPAVLGQGPSQQEQQMQAQLQQLGGALQKTVEELGRAKLELKSKEELRDIEGYDAETKRIAALQKLLPTDAEGLKAMIHQLVGDALQTHITQVQAANAQEATTADQGSQMTQQAPGGIAPGLEQPPVPGARKAPDGQWYVGDPTRAGKFARVRLKAKEAA